FGLEVFSAPRRQPRVPRATASLLGAMRTACSAAGVFALLSFVAAADCADYSCSADQDQETAALLQHAAAAQLKKAHASGQVNTTETTTLTCYPDRATATCGASGKCFLDTAGCSPSGGGTCCMAAGTHGPKQCRFCNCFGTDYCANFPSPTPSPPSPSPTPTPPTTNCPQPGPLVYGDKCEYAPNGYWYGCCHGGLVCTQPSTGLGGYPTCQHAPTPAPTPPTTNCPQPGPLVYGDRCEYAPNGYWYGCCHSGLVCTHADTADDELPPAGGQRLRGLLRVRPERVLVRLLPAWPRLREVLPWGWRIPHLPAAHRHNRRPLR
ncbi:unnamed protein product, partial [Prorocentrum cordatum]